jgi:hypothetical protein
MLLEAGKTVLGHFGFDRAVLVGMRRTHTEGQTVKGI